jgi:hypothetical protein
MNSAGLPPTTAFNSLATVSQGGPFSNLSVPNLIPHLQLQFDVVMDDILVGELILHFKFVGHGEPGRALL